MYTVLAHSTRVESSRVELDVCFPQVLVKIKPNAGHASASGCALQQKTTLEGASYYLLYFLTMARLHSSLLSALSLEKERKKERKKEKKRNNSK